VRLRRLRSYGLVFRIPLGIQDVKLGQELAPEVRGDLLCGFWRRVMTGLDAAVLTLIDADGARYFTRRKPARFTQ